MNKYLVISTFLLSFLTFLSCNENPPIILGLTKSKLIIITSPDSAIVKINNNETNESPSIFSDLEPGFFKIDITKPFYLDTTIYYILQRNRTDTLKIKLKENPIHWWKTYISGISAIPTNQTGKILIDKNDLMWIATKGSGILKFDGNNFTIINTSNSNLPDNNVNDIYFDEENNFWVSTRNGLAKYDGTRWLIFNKSNSALP